MKAKTNAELLAEILTGIYAGAPDLVVARDAVRAVDAICHRLDGVDRVSSTVNRSCEHCGAAFLPKKAFGRFCSKSCRQKAARKRAA